MTHANYGVFLLILALSGLVGCSSLPSEAWAAEKNSPSREPSSVPSPEENLEAETFDSKFTIQSDLGNAPKSEMTANQVQEFRQQINKKLESLDQKINLLDEKVWSTQGVSAKNLKYKVNHIKNIRANLSNNLDRLNQFNNPDSYKRFRASVSRQFEQLVNEVKNALE